MKLKVQNVDIDFGTNVLEIEVPKQLRKKITTGLEYIDVTLGGRGFTPSMVTLFTGTPGAGKTSMMLIMANSLTKNGGAVVFNTAEESLHQVKMTAERLRLRSGFLVGQEIHVPTLLKKCEKIRNSRKYRNKPFMLIVDSLQCMNDGKYGDNVNSKTPERSLRLITEWCKENWTNAVVIGQVNKGGQMAGTNKLKHMVDAMIHLDVERRDKDLEGCRVLEATKNRFGGCGTTFFLAMNDNGFEEVARVSAHGV
jgi:DNA repair protein RadA/Sms